VLAADAAGASPTLGNTDTTRPANVAAISRGVMRIFLMTVLYLR
jgi:hypothetical protein